MFEAMVGVIAVTMFIVAEVVAFVDGYGEG